MIGSQTPTIQGLAQFASLRRFDAGVHELARYYGEATLEGFTVDWSHGGETALIYSFEFRVPGLRGWARPQQSETEAGLVDTIKSTLRTCFAPNPSTPVINMYARPAYEIPRSFIIFVRIDPALMWSMTQCRQVCVLHEMVGSKLLPHFVEAGYGWSREARGRYGGEYTTMFTDNLKKFEKFRKIHEYLIFKTNNDPAEITTDLEEHHNRFEWKFNVPNVKPDFANRVLGCEISNILGESYTFHIDHYQDDRNNLNTSFVFFLDEFDFEDLWNNNSVAAVYDVLGKVLTLELLSAEVIIGMKR